MKLATQPAIALAMIIKGTDDEAPLLAKCLASINGYVDAIYVNLNVPKGEKVSPKVRLVCEQAKANIYVTEWTGNFVTARTFIFNKVPKKYDWIVWLDSDDTVDKPRELRNIIAVASPLQQGIYANYDYDHDEFGNTTVSHYVARIVRNNGSYEWKSSIDDGAVAVHETLNEVIPRAKAISNDFKVVHHAEGQRRTNSLIRNIKLLEGMYERQAVNGEMDPRTLFYLATHYYDASEYEKAKGLFSDYLQLSGWAEERCEALVYLGQILSKEGRDDQARKCYLQALGEYQNSPRPYIELSELEYYNKRYEESLGWAEKCLQLPKALTTMVVRPMENTYKAYLLAAQAGVNIGGKKLDEARDHINEALKLRPTDKDGQAARDLIEQLIEQRENTRAIARIIRLLEKDKEKNILPLLNLLPPEVQDNPLILNTRHHYVASHKWPKRSIALYVGQGPLGIWGPWSLAEGIGGSEEAVIRLSKELTTLGWKVVVYSTPGERAGEYDGVEYRQYYEFNPADKFDVVISWRNPAFYDVKFNARKKYLWLHDVVEKPEFTKERVKNFDRAIFVSQYHADLYKDVIPDSKRFVSGNGIDPSYFEVTDSLFERDPRRMIYMSSYNRGLKILLDMWPDVKKAVPDATLDIYYGWGSYDAINQDNPERMQWKRDLVKQMKELDGVTDHGKIGQDEIVEVTQQSGILAYPCIFPEVYCISLIKAMAGGCYPVTSDYAVVGDYNTVGPQVHFDIKKFDEFKKNYKQTLIKELQTKHTKHDVTAIRTNFSWERTAKSWNNDMQ